MTPARSRRGTDDHCEIGGAMARETETKPTTITITKKELIDRIAEKTGQKRVVVKMIVQSVLDEVVNDLGEVFILGPALAAEPLRSQFLGAPDSMRDQHPKFPFQFVAIRPDNSHFLGRLLVVRFHRLPLTDCV